MDNAKLITHLLTAQDAIARAVLAAAPDMDLRDEKDLRFFLKVLPGIIKRAEEVNAHVVLS
jgi:hypothetical protein